MFGWQENRVSVGTALFLCVTTAAVSVLGCFAAMGWRTSAVEDKLREIDRIAAEQFVGDMDEEKVADYAAVGYVTGLDDQWSTYIPADQYEAYRLSGEGKGSGIGVTVIIGEDNVRVSLVCDDSPAAQAGIQKGDYIVGAAGLTVEKDGADAVVDAIQGEEGTEITVSFSKEKGGAVQEATMQRVIVTQKMAWGQMLDGNIAYIRIENFHAGAAEQFRQVLDGLLADGAQSLVLDVRHNGGGRVKEMSEMLDPLLPEGTIMTLRTKSGSETVYESDADKIDQPIAVLVDDQSISAAEFFAAALQEYDRATLVGTHTTGKGRAQQTFALSDGSALNLSVEEYFTPKGNNLAGVGIAPDIEVALTDAQLADFYFLSPAQDPQLQKAVEILG
ncbi:S41 family peptidase [Candidatus Agathobaculum pullicola]|uniref:S41 family peptidase n=1 Tax=Candidatus Agathobaculum pullicola TaxID=2838426 RepID=UPI003F90D799